MPNTSLVCGPYHAYSSDIRSHRAHIYVFINPLGAYIPLSMSNLMNRVSSIPNQPAPQPPVLISLRQRMLFLPLFHSSHRHSYTLRRLTPRATILTCNNRLQQRRPLLRCIKVTMKWVQELIQQARHLRVLHRQTQKLTKPNLFLNLTQPNLALNFNTCYNLHNQTCHRRKVPSHLKLHQTPIL